MYADSSLARANVSGHNLSPSGMTVEEFREKAVEENGLFIVREQQTDEEGVVRESVSYYHDAKGRLPLSQVDTDARWRTTRHDMRPNLHYQRERHSGSWWFQSGAEGDSCKRRRLEAPDRNVGAATDQT